MKLDLVLHGNILHGDLYEKWKEFYKKLVCFSMYILTNLKHKASIVSNSKELNSLNLTIGMTVFLLPGFIL